MTVAIKMMSAEERTAAEMELIHAEILTMKQVTVSNQMPPERPASKACMEILTRCYLWLIVAISKQ